MLNKSSNSVRKFKTWDFSARLFIKKNLIHKLHSKDQQKYSTEMASLGIWTRDYLIDLGPTFIKLGQVLSSRQDLFPKEFVRELEVLQDNMKGCMTQEDISYLINTELNEPVEKIFKKFEYSPYKTASLGQVHRGILNSGINVAVKLQRPGIKEIILEDLDTIVQIIDFLELLGISTGQSTKVVFMETKEKLLDELDYRIEANNALYFREAFKNENSVIIPRVFISKSTSKILIMEWVPGIKITNENVKNKKEISKLLIKIFLFQIVNLGTFHADPHPGNLAISSSGKIIIYDFGLVVRLPQNITNNSKDIITSIIRKDINGLVDLFISLGLIIPDSDNRYEISIFFISLINYIEKTKDSTDSVKQEILNKLSEDKPFIIPGSFVFLGKTLTLIEGICTQLDSEFKFIDYVKPYFEDSIMESVDIQKMVQNTIEIPSKIEYISNSLNNLEQQKVVTNQNVSSSLKRMNFFLYFGTFLQLIEFHEQDNTTAFTFTLVLILVMVIKKE